MGYTSSSWPVAFLERRHKLIPGQASLSGSKAGSVSALQDICWARAAQQEAALPGCHHHDPVATLCQRNGQGPHHIPQATCLAPGCGFC